jgi:hypothetical protein
MALFKEVLQLSILEHQQDEEVGVWLLRVRIVEDHQLPHGHKLDLHVLELVLKRTRKLLMIIPRMMPWGIAIYQEWVPLFNLELPHGLKFLIQCSFKMFLLAYRPLEMKIVVQVENT